MLLQHRSGIMIIVAGLNLLLSELKAEIGRRERWLARIILSLEKLARLILEIGNALCEHTRRARRKLALQNLKLGRRFGVIVDHRVDLDGFANAGWEHAGQREGGHNDLHPPRHRAGRATLRRYADPQVCCAAPIKNAVR